MKPWHDAPPCRDCGLKVTTPAAVSSRGSDNVKHLWCPSCGEDWIEDDLNVVVQSWRSWGAYEGKCASEDARS